jgi:hypothetical protein
MGGPVNMVGPDGQSVSIPEDQIPVALGSGYKPETSQQAVERLNADVQHEKYGGVLGSVEATGAGALRGITGGLSDVGLRAMYGEQGRRELEALQQEHPTLSTAGEIGGTLLGVLESGGTSLLAKSPAAAITRLGARVAEVGEGAGAVAKIGKAALGGSVEGALYGAGGGISELALSKDPVTTEQIASTLSSNMLYGAKFGGALGGAGKALELGLGRAKVAIDDFQKRGQVASDFEPDIASMDAKQLKAARATEVDSIKAAQQTEREGIEAQRVADKKQLADDITAHREQMNSDKAWLVTKGADDAEIRTIGKQAMNAEKQLRALTDNPYRFAEKPEAALPALQKQQHTLEEMLRVEPKLRGIVAADETGARAAALDTVQGALERNKALQQRIRDVTSEIKLKTPDTSPRLTQIDEAKELLASGKGGEKTLAEQMAQGSAYSVVHGAVSAVPFVGPFLAPLVGARASRLITDQVFGRAGKAASEVARRGSAAVQRMLSAGTKVARTVPPVATATLAAVRFAPEGTATAATARGGDKLASLYKQRSEEIRSQTMYAPDGTVQMRPDARAQVAERLKPIAAVDPVAADHMETVAARRIEFLASKLPRRPDIGGLPLSASDKWQPSDMEMRTFARYVAAVEDPNGVLERVADGTVTPGDVEVMKNVYTEMHNDYVRQVSEQLPEMRTELPYRQRLALSRFTGEAVDASMTPRILSVLQQSFVSEQGTQGGTAPPMPKPNFGALGTASKTAFSGDPTPAHRRLG